MTKSRTKINQTKMQGGRPPIKVLTCDGKSFEIPERLAFMSNTIRQAFGKGHVGQLELAEVSASQLTKILEYLEYHIDDPMQPKNMRGNVDFRSDWEKEYCAVDNQVFYKLLLAAKALEIPKLLDTLCVHVAMQIKGKTPQEIRAHFGIKPDSSEEELQRVSESDDSSCS